MIRRALIGLVIAAGTLVPAAPAGAHARFLRSTPEEGSKVTQVPESLTIEFSEPPISGDNLIVADGCGDDVVTQARVAENDIVADLADARAGRWEVSFRVVSAVDGHPTEDSFSFRVAGQADCSGNRAAPPPREEDDSSSSAPILIALGVATVVLVAGGLFLRRRA